MHKHPLIRQIYLYLFTLIGLILITIGCVRLIGLVLKTYIFTKADVFYEYPIAQPVIAPSEKDQVETQQASEKEIEAYQENQRSSQRQRDAAESLALLIAGIPLYLYHWRLIKRDKLSEEPLKS
ncbi:hypothetical protein GW765_02650 [Candidatus Parcubacteria bacterium]|uniref:DUF5671 domain-containing protein n=1 Tax=Candidatus Berkelbacteria bacterium CG_4_10_14_0_8_um_filter_42_34 TaxID=1974502 RepID=A0A2M7SW36_9BACT|nr:hypothetical protein [Candidatus Parcubacteria bacterium]PIZ27392.1 MAG: hypothetical protein COY45_02715 [Candidatus Berkelbacteria bacterium CG_4_10_14_0_8_um_filter_42_34]